jgi:hypothetical protein
MEYLITSRWPLPGLTEPGAFNNGVEWRIKSAELKLNAAVDPLSARHRNCGTADV